jgi:hypothetical protein
LDRGESKAINIRMSVSTQSSQYALVEILHWACRRVAASIDFTPTATVEMRGTRFLDHAMAYARSGAFRARWRRRIDAAADKMEWDFEDEEDAILFLLKFGRCARKWKAQDDKYRGCWQQRV